jgi:cell division septation protein DedD
MKPGSGIAVTSGRWRVVAAATNAAPAAALAERLIAEGYPARIKTTQAPSGSARTEVRINRLATQPDAQALLAKIAAVDGVNGRVALAAG